MTAKRFIDYYCRQKDWWRNMDNIVINYRHCSEKNSMQFVHMTLPKMRIDRICGKIGFMERIVGGIYYIKIGDVE